MTPEQALAVNVAGKGIVLIIGCGHQTLERAVARTEALFDEPLYGVIGGLHFPVTGSRIRGGVQRVIGTGKPPWQFIEQGRRPGDRRLPRGEEAAARRDLGRMTAATGRSAPSKKRSATAIARWSWGARSWSSGRRSRDRAHGMRGSYVTRS